VGTWPPNLDWITDRLAVGGGVDSGLAERLAGELGISAIVDLRAEARHDPALLERHGMKLLHLPTEDHCAVDQAALDQGVAFVAGELAAGSRVLVHCREGVGRSALLALCVLVDQGAAPLEALTLAKDRRWQVSPSPAQYEAWAAWLRRRGIAAPDFDAFRAVAYRHLAGV
jgi:protein-tyrosine phosphatase